MAGNESTLDLVLRARAVTQAAFAEVQKELVDLGVKSKETGDGAKSAGDGLLSFSASTKQSFESMGMAVGLAGGAVLALGAGIVALGVHGADVADVRGSFDLLNKAIGNDTTAALGALKTSFAGTVSDYDLMKLANVGLSAGLKASAMDFGLLGDSARVLSDRGLATAEEAFGTLSKAMATGKLKSAELLIGNIDAEAAYRAYGASIHKAAGDLTEAEKITATSIAITARLKDEVMAGGKAQFDFGDAVAAAGVMVDNFKDSLGEAIATSPVVNAMLGSFKVGLQSAFGVDQQAQVKTLTGYVNAFALGAVDAAKFTVEAARVIINGFLGVRVFLFESFAALTVKAREMIDHTLLIGGAYRLLMGVITPFADLKPFDRALISLGELKTQLGGVGGSFKDTATDALDSAARINGGLDATQKHLGIMRGEMVKAMTATKEKGAEIKIAEGHVKGYGEGVEKMSKEAVKALKDQQAEWKKLNADIDKLGKDSMGVFQAIDKGLFGPLNTKFPETIGLTKEMGKALADMAANTMPLGEAISKGLFGPIERDLDELPPKLASFGDSLGGLSSAFTNLAQISGGTFGAIVQQIGTVIGAMKLGEEAGKSMKAGWAQIGTEGKGNLAAGLATMSTGVLGAVGAMAQATETGSTLTKTLGGMATGAKIGTMIMPGFGTAIGAAAGAAIGLARGLLGVSEELKELRKWNTEIDKVRESLLATHGPLESLDAKAKAVGMSFKNEWGHQGKAGLDMFNAFIGEFNTKIGAVNTEFSNLFAVAASTGQAIPAHLRPTIDHLIQIGVLTKENAMAFGLMGQEGDLDFRKMEDAAKRYGIDLAALGPAFQSAKLHDAAKTIWEDFELLKGGGADVSAVLQGMSGKISMLVQDSLAFGTAIPENFRPLITKLIESGLLVDANGNKLTDLSNLQFDDPIVSGFQSVIKKIEELIAAIGGPLLTEIGRIPKSIPFEVIGTYIPPDIPTFDGPGPGENEGFARGGILHAPASGAFFRGHGREAVIPLDRPSPIGHQLIREIVRTSAGGGSDARLSRIEDAIAALVASQRTLPETLVRAQRDGQLQLGTVR